MFEVVLAVGTKKPPVPQSYPVRTGIGAFGAVAYGMVFLGEASSALRLGLLLLLIGSITGL